MTAAMHKEATKSLRGRSLISASRISCLPYPAWRMRLSPTAPPPAETVNDIAAIIPKLGDSRPRSGLLAIYASMRGPSDMSLQ